MGGPVEVPEDETPEDTAPEDEALEDLASSLRRSIEALMSQTHEPDAIRDAAMLTSSAEAALSNGRPLSLEQRFHHFGRDMFQRPDRPGAEFESFSRSPVAGRLNPLATSVAIRRTDDGVEADVQLGIAHEGAPGRAHGGLTAALFDEVMGAAQKVFDRHGFTRRLIIDYLAPFPIGEPVTFGVTLDSPAGADDLTFVLVGAATAGDVVIATAEGTFTRVTADRFVR